MLKYYLKGNTVLFRSLTQELQLLIRLPQLISAAWLLWFEYVTYTQAQEGREVCPWCKLWGFILKVHLLISMRWVFLINDEQDTSEDSWMSVTFPLQISRKNMKFLQSLTMRFLLGRIWCVCGLGEVSVCVRGGGC